MDKNFIELRGVLIRHCAACSELAQKMHSEYYEGRAAAFQTAICELDDILLREYRKKPEGDEAK